MKLLLVVNPISGGNRKNAFLESAEAFLEKYGIAYAYFHTTGEDDIRKLKTAVRQMTPDRVISIGGDGTTLMTSMALQHTNVPFGIIPMGSANGMARELSVANDPILSLQDIILSQIIVPLDLVKVNDNYTIHIGDVGINAAMVDNFSKEEGRGWAAYAKHFVDAVSNAEKFDVAIEIDHEKHEHSAYSVLIANARMYGTGAIVNPQGNPHDGLFEVVVVIKNDWSGILNLGLTAVDPRAIKALEGYAVIYQAAAVNILFEKPQLLQLDGEVIGEYKKIEAEIIPAAVRYISTKENSLVGNMNQEQ